jgi:hypothetical protein
MNEFQFSIDTKQTIWERTNFYIKADSLEEAKQKLSKVVESDGIDGVREMIWDEDLYAESEHLYDTAETMSVGDNGGMPTEELMCMEDDQIIATNVQGTKQ